MSTLVSFKHDFLERLDVHLSSDHDNVEALRSLFQATPPDTDGILTHFLDHGLTTKGIDDLIRKHWTKIPHIVDEANRGFREALELCAKGDEFQSHFLMGAPHFHVFSHKRANQVYLFIEIQDIKVPFNKFTADAGFADHLEAVIARLQGLLRERN